jgi:hypothetical protein
MLFDALFVHFDNTQGGRGVETHQTFLVEAHDYETCHALFSTVLNARGELAYDWNLLHRGRRVVCALGQRGPRAKLVERGLIDDVYRRPCVHETFNAEIPTDSTSSLIYRSKRSTELFLIERPSSQRYSLYASSLTSIIT